MPTTAEGAHEFWSAYQPGFRLTSEPVGSPGVFAEIERRRYALEPDILEMARFTRWRDTDVLEAGCGMATDGKQFATAGARYTGVDSSPTAVALGRRRFDREGLAGNFIQGSITELPFEDESLDLVYSMSVIHHVPETQRVVEEFHRVLRPGRRSRWSITEAPSTTACR